MPSLKLVERIELAERNRKNLLDIPDQQANIGHNIRKINKCRDH